jgi:hypothetical protein
LQGLNVSPETVLSAEAWVLLLHFMAGGGSSLREIVTVAMVVVRLATVYNVKAQAFQTMLNARIAGVQVRLAIAQTAVEPV